MTATLRVNRTHHPVTVLGHGTRAGVWVQGCSLGCTGCVARDTWSADDGSVVPVDVIVRWLDTVSGPLDGLTLSGGEPFEQPHAVAALLGAVREWAAARTEPFDVLVYSGRSWAALRRDRSVAPALALCDAVVTGPFVQRRAGTYRLRGSGNQRIVPLTPLGEQRYGPETAVDEERPAMQVSVGQGRLFLVGIPRPGDMDRLAAGLTAAGVEHGEPTWRA